MVEVLDQSTDVARDVGELGLQPGQTLRDRSEAGIQLGDVACLPSGNARRLACTPAFPPGPAPSLPRDLPRQRLADRGAAARDGLGMLCGRKSRTQVGRLPRVQSRSGDLCRLMLQDRQPARQLPRVDGQPRERRSVGPPAVDGSGDVWLPA